MYIPKFYLEEDLTSILFFMKRYSFATIITSQHNTPTATHLPFLISKRGEDIILTSHFARANKHWEDIEKTEILVIFSEPHAYISPSHYEKELNVPTWNYIAVHAYGKGEIISDTAKTFEVLENTIDNYEIAYRHQWDNLPDDYKLKMSKGIVPFEIIVTDLQAKKKLSQNKTELEQHNIVESLSKSEESGEREIAEYMRKLKVEN